MKIQTVYNACNTIEDISKPVFYITMNFPEMSGSYSGL